MSIDMAKEIALFEEKIFTEAGETFNLASPKQLGDILFDKLKWRTQTKENKNWAICNRRRSTRLSSQRS